MHYEVIKNVIAFAREISLYPAGLSFSPIKGPEGNIEYLAYFKKSECEDIVNENVIKEVVDSSHNIL